MLIPFGGYAGGGSTSLREIAGIVCGIVLGGPIVVIPGMAYLVICIFIAGQLGNPMYFPFVFFAIPMLAMLVKGWIDMWQDARGERKR